MSIFIDIPYPELKKAVLEAEKKIGICDILPHGRFRFDFVKDCGYNVKRVEEEDGQKIEFDLIVCEALGGKSTGTSASSCRNCIIYYCKHTNTRKIKCTSNECSNFGKFHIQCQNCKIMVDIEKKKRKSFI